MMTDLYGVLGVAKGASKDEVRKAYRKAAKKTHPDAGGSREKFALTTLVHDILSDDARRARYDATGDTSEKAVDNALAQVHERLAQAFNAVMQSCAQFRQNPFEQDLVARIMGQLNAERQKIVQQRLEVKNAQVGAEKMRGRFKRRTKTANNFLDRMVCDQLAAMAQQIEAFDEQIGTYDRALELARDYEFAADKPAPVKSRPNAWDMAFEDLTKSTGKW